jgi:hypothetical protein
MPFGPNRTVKHAHLAGLALVPVLTGVLFAQDRAVVWQRTDGGRFEQELNQAAARGLRLAAITDGLPCAFVVLQAPDEARLPDEYRVIGDRDLEAHLPGLVEAGFAPQWAAPATGGRSRVIARRTAASTEAEAWRVVTFAKLEDLEGAIVAAGGDGYQARVLVRVPNRSWPGLSSTGLILAAKAPGTGKRETRVIVASGRDIAEPAKALATATAQGWSLDLLFTATGSLSTRRERLAIVLSREPSARPATRPVSLERSSTFGRVGTGTLVASAPFWDEYLFASAPSDRRQVWATPIRLADASAQCSSIEYRLRVDAPRTERSTIVGAIAKLGAIKGYELVLAVEERLGGR